MARYAEYMPNLYDTPKDLYDRLEGCIVRYDGVPYYCRTKVETNKLHLTEIELCQKVKEPTLKIDPKDPLLDISMIECMYVNFVPKGDEPRNEVFYLYRDPSKHYKSATYPQYMISKQVDGKPNNIYTQNTLMFHRGMADAILGVYPTVSDVLDRMAKTKGSMEFAVSNDVALVREKIGLIKVYYRTEMIGWIDPDEKRLKITNDDRRWALLRVMQPLGFDV